MAQTGEGGSSTGEVAKGLGGLKANVAANFVGQGFTAGLGLLLIPVYLRLLGPSAYALVGLFGVMQAWLVVLDLGTGPTLNREMALMRAGRIPVEHARDLLRTLEYLLGVVAVLVAIASLALAPWMAGHWFQESELSKSDVAVGLALMGVLMGLRLIESLYRSALLGMEAQVTYNAVTVAASLMRAVGSVTLLVVGHGTLVQFFIWQLVVSISTVVVLAASAYRRIGKGTRIGRFSRTAIRGIRAFAGGILAITSISLVLTQVGILTVSKFAPMQDVGFYAACWTLASGLLFIAGPVTQAWFPRMTDLWGQAKREELARIFHVGAQSIAVLAGTVAMLVVAFSPEIVRLWLGPNADLGIWVGVLCVLTIGTFCNCLIQLPYYAQLASGWTALAATANAIALPVLIPLVVWGVASYGVLAAALGWLAINLGLLCVVAPLTFRRVLQGQRNSWVLQDVIVPVAMIAIVGALGRLSVDRLPPNWTGGVLAASAVTALALGTATARSLAPIVRARLSRFAG